MAVASEQVAHSALVEGGATVLHTHVIEAALPELVLTRLASTADRFVTAGYGAYVPDVYEIGVGFATEIGAGAVMEIG